MVYLHDVVKLVHTDLKPENILFETENNYKFLSNLKEFSRNQIEKYNDILNEDHRDKDKEFPLKLATDLSIKIIDFGGAVYLNETHSGLINTRQYRSPEVLLGCCKWNEKSDVWSLGCIFAELFTGELLFPTHSTMEHVGIIERNAKEDGEAYPNWMVESKKYDEIDFIKDTNGKDVRYKVNLNRMNSSSFKNYIEFKTLKSMIKIEDFKERVFYDFVMKMLVLDPFKRMTCKEMLNHEFIKGEI